MYKSPIEVITEQINMQIENEVYKAVGNVGINVDREELLKALDYDRGQYTKGYKDRDSEIVRCKDCRYWKSGREECGNSDSVCFINGRCTPDWFCADGERMFYD